MFNSFLSNPLGMLAYYAAFLPAIVVAFTLHEFGHAITAVALGDETPRDQGRLTLNPIAHIDLIGIAFMVLLRFGWAKPVQIRPSNFKNPRRDQLIVSLAGVAMNFMTATAVYGVLVALRYAPDGVVMQWVAQFVMQLFQVSLMLCVFNLIPCPPLDGWQVLKALAGPGILRVSQRVERYGFVVLMVLSFVGGLGLIVTFGVDALQTVIRGFYGLLGVR